VLVIDFWLGIYSIFNSKSNKASIFNGISIYEPISYALDMFLVYLFFFSIFAVPIISVGIIIFNLIALFNDKYAELKDLNYLRRGLLIAVIALFSYMWFWLPFMH